MSVSELSSRRPPLVPSIHQALRSGVDSGVFPGGAAAVFLRGSLVHLSSTGEARREPLSTPMVNDAHFDLASLTKILATTPAVALLVGRGELALDSPVERYLPAFGKRVKRDITLRQLLAHSSGLPAWRPFFLEVMRDPQGRALFEPHAPTRARALAMRRGRALVLEAITASAPERSPGSSAVYSDLGFITLGFVVEAVAKERLDRFVTREVFSRVPVSTLRFRPADRARRSNPLLVSTGLRRPREPAQGQEALVPLEPHEVIPELEPGRVDDDNAFAMGGVAGHAGLFGTAVDVAAFGAALLDDFAGAERLAPAETWAEFVRRDDTPDSTRALGFDTPSARGSSAGRYIAASRAVGHLGYTGTSLWLDLDRKLAVALLTNRVHPRRGNETIRAFRPAFHDAVIEALGLTESAGDQKE